MKGCTLICHFTHTKAYLFSLNELYFLKCVISTHNFLKPEWIHSRKTTIRRKSLIFPNICHHKRQYFELLVPEIKCRYSTADLCAQIYANVLISPRCSLRTEQFTQWRGHDKNYCVGEVWTVRKWSRFTHEMSHSVYNIAGKNHQTKTHARSTRLCLEENQKTDLDPPYVCPKLQVQATFYCQHLLL